MDKQRESRGILEFLKVIGTITRDSICEATLLLMTTSVPDLHVAFCVARLASPGSWASKAKLCWRPAKGSELQDCLRRARQGCPSCAHPQMAGIDTIRA